MSRPPVPSPFGQPNPGPAGSGRDGRNGRPEADARGGWNGRPDSGPERQRREHEMDQHVAKHLLPPIDSLPVVPRPEPGTMRTNPTEVEKADDVLVVGDANMTFTTALLRWRQTQRHSG